MEKLILDLMFRSGISEQELLSKKEIPAPDGEILSWDYLTYVRLHPVSWDISTHILYGGRDAITPPQVLMEFAHRIGATVTVLENGEHWFQDRTQMAFLDQWVKEHI